MDDCAPTQSQEDRNATGWEGEACKWTDQTGSSQKGISYRGINEGERDLECLTLKKSNAIRRIEVSARIWCSIRLWETWISQSGPHQCTRRNLKETKSNQRLWESNQKPLWRQLSSRGPSKTAWSKTLWAWGAIIEIEKYWKSRVIFVGQAQGARGSDQIDLEG